MDERTTSWTPSGRDRGGDAPGWRIPAPGQLLGGRFLLFRELGRGGSGIVFAARDSRLNQAVAVKILHPGQLDSRGIHRLRREVQAARGGHPHMVTVYDLHEDGGLRFLSMELVEGESLRKRLEEGPLPVEEAVEIGRQVASALAHLHERGIVHRDVKPGNILLTAGGEAKLCDMGLARSLVPGMTVTETAMVVGTPAYMAPEQATGKELTAAADVYALGLTLHRALTGEVPLTDVTALSTLMRRQRQRAPSVRRTLPGAPRWLARLILHMLDPDPARRPPSSGVESALARGVYRYRPRRRTVAAVAVAVALAVAVPAIQWRLANGRTRRFELSGQELRGIDEEGRTTWTRRVPGQIVGAVRADLDGDGSGEQIILTRDVDHGRGQASVPAGVTMVDLQGRVVGSVLLRDLIGEWAFSYPVLLTGDLSAADLDEDGRSELIVLARQIHFFPSELLVYWPARDAWQIVLEHPGYLRLVTALPGRHRPALRFAGVLNRPVLAPVAGQITLEPSAVKSFSLRASSRLQPGARSVPGAFLDWYTILACRNKGLLGSGARLAVREDGGTLLEGIDGRSIELDPWGNPDPGPNAGRDLSTLRCRFMASLAGVRDFTDAAAPQAIVRRVGQIRETVAPLLAETPYRIALDIREACSLANTGDPPGAIAILRDTVRDTANEDAIFRLAHLLGVTGRLEDAVAVLEPVVAMPATQRANFDGRLLLFHLAVELRDRPLARRCLLKWPDSGKRMWWNEGTTAAMLAWAHLWWDEAGETDCRVRSWPYEPAGEALACLARWRLGRTAPEDAEAMHRGAKANPEAVDELRIAEAAVQLGLGHPGETLVVLDRLEPGLQRAAAGDFEKLQLLQLARALRAKALLAAGQPGEARHAAQALLPRLTPGLLPAHLAKEVLGTNGAP